MDAPTQDTMPGGGLPDGAKMFYDRREKNEAGEMVRQCALAVMRDPPMVFVYDEGEWHVFVHPSDRGGGD